MAASKSPAVQGSNLVAMHCHDGHQVPVQIFSKMRRLVVKRKPTLWPLVILAICACSGHGSSPTVSSSPSLITTPTLINLYPSTDNNRLYIYLTAIGEKAVTAPLIFDTGSAGLTLDAHAVFPPSMFDSSGRLLFASDHTPLSYSGVRVMPEPAEKAFGGVGGTTLYGYVGYAQVSFGDTEGQLTTSQMPVFLYDSTSSPGNPTGYGDAQGIFGVDNLADQVAESFTRSPLAVCEPQSGPPCYVVSVLKYLSYAPGLDAGFLLNPARLVSCSISSTPGDCQPEPMLAVGLNAAVTDGFTVKSLVCPPSSSEQPAYYGPNMIRGYQVCEKSIAGADISIYGPMASSPLESFLSFPGPVLFDTGTEDNEVEDTSLSSKLTLTGGTVVVTLPVPFSYSYMIGAVTTNTLTTLRPTVNNNQNHIGVGYFESNYFFLNYASGTEGWMLRQQ